MQLYKNFFKLIKAHRTQLIIYVCIMLVYSVLMIVTAPMLVGNNEESATERNVSYRNLGVTLRDHDDSALSRGMKTFIERYGEVDMDNDSTQESINDILYFNITDFFIEIPEGFQASVEAGEPAEISYTASNQQDGKTFSFVNDMDSFVNMYRAYRAMGLSEEEAVAQALETAVSDVTFGVVSEHKEVKAGGSRAYALNMILKYYLYTVLGVMCLGVGAVIATSNKKTVSDRIDASPVKPTKRILTMLAGMLTVAAVIIVVMVIFAYIYGGSTSIMKEYGWVVILNLITSTFYISGFTLLVSSFSLRSSTINLIVNSFGMAMCFLCGVFVPFEILGSSVQKLAHFLPFYWSARNMDMIYPGSGMNYEFSASSVFASLGVQILFGIVFVLIAMIIKKTRRVEA